MLKELENPPLQFGAVKDVRSWANHCQRAGHHRPISQTKDSKSAPKTKSVWPLKILYRPALLFPFVAIEDVGRDGKNNWSLMLG
jgi:hypothetical protein